jgi:pimeloyl-ACP methyl ester carboxylesterase
MSRRSLLLLAAALGLAIASARALGPPAAATHSAFGRGPTIALVHGLGSNREHWLPVARLLAVSHRVELIDLPGHGESSMPAPFSLERATASLDGSLASLSADNGPVVLVGHSLGGLVAASEAIAHPERVRALVLVETALRPQVAPADRAALLDALDHDYDALIHAAYLDFGRDSVQGEQLYREVRALDPAMVKPWIRLAFSADLSAAAAQLRVPVLVVLAPRSWGDSESWSSVSHALGYDATPGLRAVRLAGCGHFVMLDRPTELAQLIVNFAADPLEAHIAVVGRE